VPGLDIEVLAEEELLELGLERPLGLTLGSYAAVVALEDQPGGHRSKLLSLSTGIRGPYRDLLAIGMFP